MQISPSARRAAAVGLACSLAVLAWQYLTVRHNYNGQWSALFCTGERTGVPTFIEAEKPYRFPGVQGWDGQWYHAIAHDPLLRRGADRRIDLPRLRYRRILIPAMAHGLAAGGDAFVDAAYRLVILLAFAAGAAWLSWIAQAAGRSPLWGFGFLLFPASVAAIDRQAVDVGLLCLACGFALYSRSQSHWPALVTVLILACLARETGLLLIPAYCLSLLIGRQFGRAALSAAAAIPALSWYAYVSSRVPPDTYVSGVWPPFSGLVHRFMNPQSYPDAAPIAWTIRGLDYLALCGTLLALILGLLVLRRKHDPVALAAALFALVGVFIWRPGDWLEAIDYGRILSPLLLFLALGYIESGRAIALAPLLMIAPRFAIQMASQALGVVRGVLS